MGRSAVYRAVYDICRAVLQDADGAINFQRISDAKEVLLNRPSVGGGNTGMGMGPGMPHRAYADPDVEAMRRRESEEEFVADLRRQTEEIMRQFNAWVAECNRQLREACRREQAEAQARHR